MEDLRQALRRLAKAVVVITAWHEGSRYAMAATAVSELSFDPPSLLICVNRSASLHAPLSAGAPFAVNILHHGQEHIAARCSGAIKGEERFGEGECRAWRGRRPAASAATSTGSTTARTACASATSNRCSSTACPSR